VTDSNAMLPAELVTRFDVLVVPLTVVIDGDARPEPEVEPGWFYARLRCGATVTTAAPSPGELRAAYREAAAAGAEEILSIHVGSNYSATVTAARLAAAEAAVPVVVVVDTMTASFVEGCCVWRAAEALARGESAATAAERARAVAAEAGSVFTVGEPARARRSGRVEVGDGSGVVVLGTAGPEMFEIGRVDTAESAVEAMVRHVASRPGPLRVGIGHADAPTAADALERALHALPQVHETVRYVVGPSVAAHTGVGTVGAVFHRI